MIVVFVFQDVADLGSNIQSLQNDVTTLQEFKTSIDAQLQSMQTSITSLQVGSTHLIFVSF